MLQLSIAGNVGQEPELRTTPSGSAVLNFSVGVSYWSAADREKQTQWVRVAVWGKRGEGLAKVLAKGAKVACCGEMRVRTYEGRSGTGVSVELNAQTVTLQSSRGEAPQARTQAPANLPQDEGYGDDDIPF